MNRKWLLALSASFVLSMAMLSAPVAQTATKGDKGDTGAKVEKGAPAVKKLKLVHTEKRYCNTGKLGRNGKPGFRLCKPTEKGKSAVAKDAPKPDTPEGPAAGDVKTAK